MIRTAVKEAKQQVVNEMSSHSGDKWRAMSMSTNIRLNFHGYEILNPTTLAKIKF